MERLLKILQSSLSGMRNKMIKVKIRDATEKELAEAKKRQEKKNTKPVEKPK